MLLLLRHPPLRQSSLYLERLRALEIKKMLKLNEVYQLDAIKLLQSIPDQSIDALITDPPYSSGGLTASSRKVAPELKYLSSHNLYKTFTGDNRDQRSQQKWLISWLDEAFNKMKDGSVICVFSDWRQLPITTDALQMSGYIWLGIAVWDKTQMVRPQPHRFRNQAEYIVWGAKGTLSKDRTVPVLPGVYTCPIYPKEKQHITAKPLALMDSIVKICEPKGLIVDPFCGSGTTLVAAKKAGYQYLGCDLMDYNVEITKSRLAEV